ncbi:MAG: hypothetical protein OXH58_10305 [Acidimicrobiaceae bacterium]|nr:hypothetical protein [Acidimicrobiaceae bacterium]
MTVGDQLRGLDGRTPLGFMAALGVQAALSQDDAPTLHWETDSGQAIIGGRSIDELASRVVESYKKLIESPVVTGDSVRDDLKFETSSDVRVYLGEAQAAGGLAAAFAAAQVSEGANARNGRAKPSALHFTSGQMKFLEVVRAIATGRKKTGQKTDHTPLSAEAVRSALTSPGKRLTLLRWGEMDGRTHALGAVSPAEGSELRRVKRITNPALTALALLGMSRFPTWTSDRNRCVTTSFFGRWPHTFVWPLWERAAGSAAVASLLAQARPSPDDVTVEHYEAWGVSAIWAAPVHRAGRYLSFGGARAAWQAPRTSTSAPVTA